MFSKLAEIESKYEHLMSEMATPAVQGDACPRQQVRMALQEAFAFIGETGKAGLGFVSAPQGLQCGRAV